MRNKGSILIYLVLAILVALAGYIFFNYQKVSGLVQKPKDSLNILIHPLQSQSPKDWKSLSNPDLELKLSYPPDWLTAEDGVISQFYLPDRLSDTKVYNKISFGKHTGVLYLGYFDTDLFEKLYKLSPGDSLTLEYFNQDNRKLTYLSSGKIKSGQRFVIIKPESDRNPNEDIKAFILDSNSIIILTLTHYDDTGTDTFKKIVASSNLNGGN